ncbi:hypothetical protein [Lutibaculum baratangense]|uniref:Uncharacterized protein n=1 Tax=Lutibaculum baratangense AMV1 TaxID=631454 RepID=V4TK40_9HYPH|nr:hypothetical protein [Lutibaculum baratangense]ESR26258.1 hypothetical protein N177_1117 [Lutibaculum baratangense AMV1]
MNWNLHRFADLLHRQSSARSLGMNNIIYLIGLVVVVVVILSLLGLV